MTVTVSTRYSTWTFLVRKYCQLQHWKKQVSNKWQKHKNKQIFHLLLFPLNEFVSRILCITVIWLISFTGKGSIKWQDIFMHILLCVIHRTFHVKVYCLFAFGMGFCLLVCTLQHFPSLSYLISTIGAITATIKDLNYTNHYLVNSHICCGHLIVAL